MKFDSPIEVSGIRQIVINREQHWVRGCNDQDWYLLDELGEPNPGETWKKSSSEMMRFVSKLLSKLKRSRTCKGCFTWVNRAWVHGDTLNIVRRDSEGRAAVLMTARNMHVPGCVMACPDCADEPKPCTRIDRERGDCPDDDGSGCCSPTGQKLPTGDQGSAAHRGMG